MARVKKRYCSLISFVSSSVDVPFSEGPVNLSWGQIMKTINDDPGIFFKEGGWSFLSGESDVRKYIDHSIHEFLLSF